MSELKFRVFNSKTSCMSNVMDYETSWNDGELLPIRKMFTFMQYTGLKDKTGKEIYEGDILNHKPLNEKLYSVGKIEYSNIHAQFFIKNNHGTGTRLPETMRIEIIGNIHENPELLS